VEKKSYFSLAKREGGRRPEKDLTPQSGRQSLVMLGRKDVGHLIIWKKGAINSGYGEKIFIVVFHQGRKKKEILSFIEREALAKKGDAICFGREEERKGEAFHFR